MQQIGKTKYLSKQGVFAIVGLGELGGSRFFAPKLTARPVRRAFEARVAFTEVTIDRRLCLVDRFVVAVVNDGAGHSAEN